MDTQATRPAARAPGARLRFAVAAAMTALLCAALPIPAAAAGPARPAAGPQMQHEPRVQHVVSSNRLLTELGIRVDNAHVSRSRGLASPALGGASLCVGGGFACFSTIQAAVDAAHDGDTIHVGAGTFAGGITILKSVKLAGVGARSTTIRGGGAVLTIGAFGAATEPTVTIDGVTITGGVTRSSPESSPFVGQESVVALGGGVEVPPGAGFTAGATVTIRNSVITGNRVAPVDTLPFGPPCPDGACPFALAAGGAIDNWGTMLLANTTVSNNRVGSASGLSTVASDAEGGGIMSWPLTTLTLTNSVVSGNRTSATAPNGRFADGGGIFFEGGTLTINGGAVTNNSAELSSDLPNSVEQLAIAGGVHVSDSSSSKIRGATISGNSVAATNTAGDANAFSGGIHSDGPLVLANDTISNNTAAGTASAASLGNAIVDSGAGEINGPSTISYTLFTGNRVVATAPAGFATAVAGAFISGGNPMTTISDSVISGNNTHASTSSGAIFVGGGGILNIGSLTLRNTAVLNNTGTASGPGGVAQGGGIWNSPIPDGPPATELTLVNSAVSWNRLTTSLGALVQGGGLYTSIPVTLTNSIVARNAPDQCYGC